MQEKRLQGNAQAKAPAKPKAGIIESQKKALSEKKQEQLNGMLLDAAKNGRTKRAERLLKVGASIEVKNNNGWTALMWAAYWGHTPTCALLLEKGASIEAKDNNGRTALMHAAREGYTDVCMLLVEKGADLNQKDELFPKRTSFMWAKLMERKETAAFLKHMEWLAGITGNAFMKPFGECVAG
jgi:ankyrin repeat protein